MPASRPPDPATAVPPPSLGAPTSPGRPPLTGKRIAGLAALVAVLLAFAVAIPLLIHHLVQSYALRTYKVPTTSMEPAVEAGDRVLVDRVSYRFDEPSRGDVVLVDTADGDVLGRVIATGGQTVQCCDPAQRLLIDTVPIDEPYLRTPGAAQPALGPVVVPAGSLFVLGDNRAGARSYIVDEDDVTGRAVLVVWPTDNWGPIDDGQGTDGQGTDSR